MTKHKAIKYRACPNAEQRELFAQTFGCVRKVFNECLSYQQERYANGEKHLSKNALNNYCNSVLKEKLPFLRTPDKFSLTNSVYNLNDAYDRFFKGLAGFPKFKSKRKSKKSYTTNISHNNIAVGDGYVKLPKAGYVKARIHRIAPESWKLKSATILQSGSGKYYISVLYEYEEEVAPVAINSDNVRGMDYKSNGLYVDDEGFTPGSPRYTHKYADKLAKELKKLSRKQGYRKGEVVSKNFLKQLAKVNRVYEKIANCRLDFLHKLSLSIAKKADAVCIEDLNMTDIAHAHRFRNYRKVTYDNGFGIFRTLLEYKLADRGKKLVKVDKDFPSSKTCSSCGYVLPELDDTVRTWTCPECGSHHDRDVNAAINIKMEGLRLLNMPV